MRSAESVGLNLGSIRPAVSLVVAVVATAAYFRTYTSWLSAVVAVVADVAVVVALFLSLTGTDGVDVGLLIGVEGCSEGGTS